MSQDSRFEKDMNATERRETIERKPKMQMKTIIKQSAIVTSASDFTYHHHILRMYYITLVRNTERHKKIVTLLGDKMFFLCSDDAPA